MDQSDEIQLRDRFAQAVLEALEAAGFQGHLTYDQASFCIRTSSGTVYLTAPFDTWRNADLAGRGAIVRNTAVFLNQSTAPVTAQRFDDVRDNVLPAIRNMGQMINLWLNPTAGIRPGEFRGAFQRLPGPVAAFAAIDGDTSLTYVTAAMLEQWRVSFEEVMEQAKLNLRAKAPPSFRRMDGGFLLSDYGDDYDASRLLLPRVLMALPVEGHPVCIPISRDKLAIAGSENPRALNAMAAFVDDAYEPRGRPIARAAMILGPKGWGGYQQAVDVSQWSVFFPNGVRPTMPPLIGFLGLSQKQMLEDYDVQKVLLDRYFAAKGAATQVANLTIIRKTEQGPTVTCTLAPEHGESLLPQADLVGVQTPKGQFFIPSRHFKEMGTGKQENFLFPPRFRFRGWKDGGESFKVLDAFLSPANKALQ